MGLITPNINKLVKEGDTEGLQKCLRHKKAEIRLKAFNALFHISQNDTDLMNRMCELTRDKEPKVRIETTLRFATLGRKDIMEEMKYAIVNGSKSEKFELLRSLADHYKARDESVSNLLVLALNDKTAMVQIEAMKTMGLMKDTTAVYHLSEMLHDRRHALRIESVLALGNIATAEAIDLLIGSLMDKNPDVRRAARESLEKIGTDRAMKATNDAPFMLLVKRMNSNVATKLDTIQYIAKMKIQEGLPLIRKACSDEFKNVRIEAIKTIGIFKDKYAMKVLARSIEDPYFDVRLETVRTLERLVLRESLMLIEKAIKDYNHNVREEAKQAYYHLLDRIEKVESRNKKDE